MHQQPGVAHIKMKSTPFGIGTNRLRKTTPGASAITPFLASPAAENENSIKLALSSGGELMRYAGALPQYKHWLPLVSILMIGTRYWA
jgi:hypothetical protein